MGKTTFQKNINPVCQHTDKSPILKEEAYIQQLIFNITDLGTEGILDEKLSVYPRSTML